MSRDLRNLLVSDILIRFAEILKNSLAEIHEAFQRAIGERFQLGVEGTRGPAVGLVKQFQHQLAGMQKMLECCSPLAERGSSTA